MRKNGWYFSSGALTAAVLLTVSTPRSSPAATNLSGGTGLVFTESARTLDRGTLSLGFYFNFEQYMITHDPKRYDFQPTLAYAPLDNLELTLAAPYRVLATPDDDEQGIGDGTLGVKYRFLPSLAGRVYTTLPFGDEDRGLGTGTTDVGVEAIFSRQVLGFDADLNLGYRFADAGGDEGNDVVTYGLGLSLPVAGETRFFWEYFGRIMQEGDEESTAQFTGGVRFPLGERTTVTAGAGTGTEGIGPESPDYRMFLGLSWSFGGRQAAVAPPPPPPPPLPPSPPPKRPSPPPPPTPPPPPPKRPTPPPPPPVDRELQGVKTRIGLVAVYFPFDHTRLSPESREKLDEIVKNLKEHPSLRLTIDGHTDSVGTASYNGVLGRRRAETVMGYLIRAGVDPSRLKAVSHGEMEPKEDNGTDGGRAMNRRVTFTVETT